MKRDPFKAIGLLVLGLLALPAAATAQGAAPLVVTGGALDPAIASEDVFLDTPAAAAPPADCKVAAQYVAFINAGQFDKVAALYSDDGIVFSPLVGKKAVGRAQIDAFYGKFLSTVRPNIIAVAYAGSPGQCYQTHAVSRTIGGKTRYALTTVDHFVFNARGQITQMVAYGRPRQPAAAH